MRRFSPFTLALILGCGTEAVLAALFAAFGSVGPCGPGDDLTGLIMLAHMPGMMMASGIKSYSVAMPIIIGMSAATFSVVFYIFIRLVRALRHGHNEAEHYAQPTADRNKPC